MAVLSAPAWRARVCGGVGTGPGPPIRFRGFGRETGGRAERPQSTGARPRGASAARCSGPWHYCGPGVRRARS